MRVRVLAIRMPKENKDLRQSIALSFYIALYIQYILELPMHLVPQALQKLTNPIASNSYVCITTQYEVLLEICVWSGQDLVKVWSVLYKNVAKRKKKNLHILYKHIFVKREKKVERA